MQWIYLDNNATTRPARPVLDAMTLIQEQLWANPSSVHRFGQQARQRVELARTSVARLINAQPREIIFTSGGTEANNLAISGVLTGAMRRGDKAMLVTTALEHAAVREPAEDWGCHGATLNLVPPDEAGAIPASHLQQVLSPLATAGEPTTVLVSIQWANNETGVIQPVAALAGVCREHQTRTGHRVIFHVDATQAVGKLPVDVKAAGVDLLTLAGHKFHGPKGSGALFVRSGVRLHPTILGGPQERQRRGGTENVPAIAGLGVAAELAMDFLHDAPALRKFTALRDQLETGVLDACPTTLVNGVLRPRLWNTSNIAFPRLEAEAILIGLSEQRVCASAGAACSSGSLEPSPVLLAMGIPPAVAHGSVRFSLSRLTTEDDIEQALRVIPAVVAKLRETMPA